MKAKMFWILLLKTNIVITVASVSCTIYLISRPHAGLLLASTLPPFLPPSSSLSPSLPPSVTLKQSDAGERTDCAHRHSNTVLMMATSVTWRFHLRASGRGMECEATAQLTPQLCPLICFPLTCPSTYSSVSALFLLLFFFFHTVQ